MVRETRRRGDHELIGNINLNFSYPFLLCVWVVVLLSLQADIVLDFQLGREVG